MTSSQDQMSPTHMHWKVTLQKSWNVFLDSNMAIKLKAD